MKSIYFNLIICLSACLMTNSLWSQSTPTGGNCAAGDCYTTFSWPEDASNLSESTGTATDASCGVSIYATASYTGNDPDPDFDFESFNAGNQVSGSGTGAIWTDVWDVNFSASLSNPVLAFTNLYPDTQISITDCNGSAIPLTDLSDNSSIASGTFSGNREVQLSGTTDCIKVTVSNSREDAYYVYVRTCLQAVPSTSITAIGTCAGITAADDNKYNITVSGLDASTTYDIDFDGDGTDDATNVTGVTSYTSPSAIDYSTGNDAGAATKTVSIDAGTDGTYEASIIVHEVLCTDADDDGDIDFDSGCDESTNLADQGYIVATVAPYNGNNVYVYVLTDASNDKALQANFSGLFTGLASGGNGNTDDYNVVAFNLADLSEAQNYIETLDFGADGDVVTASSSSTGCSMACGSMSYDIECCVQPVATVTDQAICTETTMATLTASITTGTVNNYSIDFDNAAITDVASTVYPANNEIDLTLPSTLAAGDYTGTITFIDYVGCSGTDDFTITVKPRPTVTATAPADICVGDAVPNYTLSGTPNATVNYRVNDNGASITLDNNGEATIPASNTESTALVIASVFINGCSTTNIPSVSATVNPLPTASVEGTTICLGDAVPNFTFSGTENAVVTYKIDGGANTTITLDGSGSATLAASNTATSEVTLVSVSLTSTSCSKNLTESATVTVNTPITVEAGSSPDVCSTAAIDLTALGASISGGHTGTWTSSGTGSFDNGRAFGSATVYTPSPADIKAGSVTLKLTSADPTGPCDASNDTVSITILNVACGTFPWNGAE